MITHRRMEILIYNPNLILGQFTLIRRSLAKFIDPCLKSASVVGVTGESVKTRIVKVGSV